MDAIIVTGGAGFIGANFIHQIIETTEDLVINVDALTYAGNLENLRHIENHEKYIFRKADIVNPEEMEPLFKEFKIKAIIHFAAESHVDRSILGSREFVLTNVVGTQTLLDLALKYQVEKFVHVSTDEVYGSLGEEGEFHEQLPLKPNSPYSASKASSDLLVRSYVKTHQLPAVITRCSNNYGPYQFPEKLIPLMISNAWEDKELPIYGDGKNIRDWVYVTDHCDAVWEVYKKGEVGEVYNIGGRSELQNIQIVNLILETLNKPNSLITYVKDRPGHDFRYAMDITKIKNTLGWEPKVSLKEGLEKTVQWYLDNKEWWQHIKSGQYRNYYEEQYSER